MTLKLQGPVNPCTQIDILQGPLWTLTWWVLHGAYGPKLGDCTRQLTQKCNAGKRSEVGARCSFGSYEATDAADLRLRSD